MLHFGSIGLMDNCRVKANAEIIEENAGLAMIVKLGHVNETGLTVVKNLLQGLEGLGRNPVAAGKIIAGAGRNVGYRDGVSLLCLNQAGDHLMQGAIAADHDQAGWVKARVL